MAAGIYDIYFRAMKRCFAAMATGLSLQYPLGIHLSLAYFQFAVGVKGTAMQKEYIGTFAQPEGGRT